MYSHRLNRIEDALINIVYASLILNEFFVSRADNIHISYTINQLGVNTMDQIDVSILTISVQSELCELHPVVHCKFMQRCPKGPRKHERNEQPQCK